MRLSLYLVPGLMLLTSIFAQAQTPELVWAADIEGGAPYAFPDPSNPAERSGFEVDIVNALAARMGRQPRFVQNQWDGLILGLDRGEYDIVINGIEITPERQSVVAFSTPYYLSTLTLTSRTSDTGIRSVHDLRGRSAGALKASYAEKYLRSIPGIDVRGYDSQVQAYLDLGLGRIDGVVADSIVPPYYTAMNPDFHDTPVPTAPFAFGIAMRKADQKLLAEINQALDTLRDDGTLKRIYAEWAIYNSPTAEFFRDPRPEQLPPAVKHQRYVESLNASQGTGRYRAALPLLFEGALVTLGLSAAAMTLAVGLGMVLAILRIYGAAAVSWPVVAVIEVIRGTPLLIQLFIIFYGLPAFGLRLPPFLAAVIGLGLNYAAYEAENYRAGILSLPQGQIDAATALGLSRFQIVRYVVLPQAIRLVLPPVTNDFIALLKDSSLVSVITMVELTKVYGQLAAAYFDYIGLGLMTAAIYFVLGLPIARISKLLERRLAYMRV